MDTVRLVPKYMDGCFRSWLMNFWNPIGSYTYRIQHESSIQNQDLVYQVKLDIFLENISGANRLDIILDFYYGKLGIQDWTENARLN